MRWMKTLRQSSQVPIREYLRKMDELRVADAITEIFALFKRCNKYIDETEPWVLAKDEANMDRLATVLIQSGREYCNRRFLT